MKPDAERANDSNARKREKGLVPLFRWVHKDDKPVIVTFIEKLANKRRKP